MGVKKLGDQMPKLLAIVEREEPKLFTLGCCFSRCGNPTFGHACFVVGVELIICRFGSI